MSSNLKVNNILPSTGTTVAVSGIASVTSSVSIASSCTATTFYGGLDTNGGNIAFGDSSSNSDDVLTFGTGNDLQLHSDGTNGVLRQNNNSGGLYIQADNFVQIGKVNAGSPIYGKFIKDGAVELYHNGSKRFETTTGGNKSIKSSANTFVIGSSDAGGAHLTLDGDSNGDGSGADYCGISHNTDGNMVIYQDNPNGNGQIDFQTGGANRVSMQSDKLRPWNNEGMTLGTSGLRWGNVFTSGINFAHTSDASGMSNELLDDYEEGSWTPDIQNTGGSSLNNGYSWRTGKYTKVGNLVFCTFALGLSAAISSSSQIRLGGIPYGISGHSYFYYFVLHGYNFASGIGDDGSNTSLFGEVSSSVANQVLIVKGSSRSYATNSDIGSTQRLTGMFHYYTA